ncbi:MAG: zf-HC2 domain-containing protein [Planctomycetales bacterium]|nr:zf-HC2 domain-containing protein [Planctomycetales bacterium]
MQLLSDLKLILTLHCEESTQLMSAGLDRQLRWSERWAVRMHALVCASCRRFGRQLNFLHTAAHQCDQHAPSPNTTLSDDLRQRIAQAIRQADSEN